LAPAAGTPNRRAIASMRTGDVDARAVDTYGTSSYAVGSLPAPGPGSKSFTNTSRNN